MRKLILLLLLYMAVSLTVYADRAPEFSIAADAGQIKLSQLRGAVVYVDFWASWCVPCRKSFPWLNEMHRRYAKAGLRIIAINLDEDGSLARAFLKQYPAEFSVGFDPAGHSARVYGLQGMPSSYLIDRKGELVYSHVGFRSADRGELERKIRQALGK